MVENLWIMITEVTLKNFKLHRETKLHMAPITIFIGPNNSGKSSVFQALLSLKQYITQNKTFLFDFSGGRRSTTQSSPFLYPDDRLMILGEFKDVVRHGENRITIGLKGDLKMAVKQAPGVKIDFELTFTNNDLTMSFGTLEFWKTDTNLVTDFKDFTGAPIKWEWTRGGFQVQPKSLRIAEFEVGIGFPGPTRFPNVSSFGSPHGTASHEHTQQADEFVRAYFESPKKLIESVHPVHPVRGVEEAGLPLPSAPGENLSRAILADRVVALASQLEYKANIKERVSNWAKELLGAEIDTQLYPEYRISIQTKKEGSLFSNEGTGMQQLPFIFVPIALASPGDALLISEPEAHLHPKAQYELASLFIDIHQKENKQFFIETHSEHVLNALLTAVAKGKLGKNLLRVYYFSKEADAAKPQELEIDEHGQMVAGFPDDFFEQNLNELGEYLAALKGHQ